MIEKTLISHCLSPIKVPNRSLNSYVSVPCGHCAFCRAHKFSVLSTKVDREIYYSKYTYVFTLTYNDDCIPSISLNGSNFSLNNITDSEDVYKLKTYLSSYTSYDDFYKVSSLQHNKNKVYVNVYSHYQLFLKRLRKYFSKTSKQKIRFFLATEYGSTTYRPHAHLLLFTSSPFDFQTKPLKDSDSVICSDLTNLWKYGFVTYDGIPRSSTDVSSYISNYVNSISYIPSFLTYKLLKPRTFHSNFLGINKQITIQDIKQNTFEVVTRQDVLASDNSLLPFSLFTDTEISYFFPKFPFSTLHDTNSLTELSSIFFKNNQLRFSNIYDYTYFILSNSIESKQLFNFLHINDNSSSTSQLDFRILEDIFSTFPISSKLNIFNLFSTHDIPFLSSNLLYSRKSLEQLHTSLSRLYTIYNFFSVISKRFLNSISLSDYIHLYINYYKDLDYYLLIQTYYKLQNSSAELVSIYYSLLQCIPLSSDYYRSLVTTQLDNISSNIKHHKQSSKI